MKAQRTRRAERYPAAPNEPVFALCQRSEQGELIYSAQRYTLAEAAELARAENERGVVCWITLM